MQFVDLRYRVDDSVSTGSAYFDGGIQAYTARWRNVIERGRLTMVFAQIRARSGREVYLGVLSGGVGGFIRQLRDQVFVWMNVGAFNNRRPYFDDQTRKFFFLFFAAVCVN